MLKSSVLVFIVSIFRVDYSSRFFVFQTFHHKLLISQYNHFILLLYVNISIGKTLKKEMSDLFGESFVERDIGFEGKGIFFYVMIHHLISYLLLIF